MKKIITFLVIGMMLTGITGCVYLKESNVINIASKPMTEQYILTEIIKILIEENTDLKVEIKKGIGGGTTNIHPALLNKEFDLYPEYTRTAWLNVLKKDMIADDQSLYEELQKEYNSLGLSFIDLYGFSNTYGIAVRADTAEEYHLKTYSDLAAVSDKLIFGGNYDYIELETGYPRLCAAYDMKFKDTVDMEIALKYTALSNKEIDVTNVFTTDAGLISNNLVLLEDDKNFFEGFYAGTVVRNEILDKHPELKEVLHLMEGLISEEEMQIMNFAVEVEGKEDTQVAKEFLKEKGLIK